MAGVPGGRAGFLAITIVTFIIPGQSVLEGIPAILLFGPLLLPVARAMGVHEVHYSIIVILAMGIGLFAPPSGGRLLWRLRDRKNFAGRRAVANLAVYFRSGRGAGDRCRGALAVDWVPVAAGPSATSRRRQNSAQDHVNIAVQAVQKIN